MTCAAPPRATHTSRERQKPPVAYPATLRRMSSRVSQLTDEFALECTTNVEFEEAARRSFEFLNGQVRTLKEAINALTDSFVEEVDRLDSSVRCDLCRLDERQKYLEKSMSRDIHEVVTKQLEKHQERQLELSREQERQLELSREQERQQLWQQDVQQDLEQQAVAMARAQREWKQESEHRTEQLSRSTEQLSRSAEQLSRSTEQTLRAQEEKQQQVQRRVDAVAQDLDTIVSLIPNIEDMMHKTHSFLQDKIGESALDISRVNDAVSMERMKAANVVERLEAKVSAIESELRDDLEQKHLKLQRSITRQLESMSRVLIESDWTLRPSGKSLQSSPAAIRRPEPDLSASSSLLHGLQGLPLPPSLPQSSRLLDLDLSSLALPRYTAGEAPGAWRPTRGLLGTPEKSAAFDTLGAASRLM